MRRPHRPDLGTALPPADPAAAEREQDRAERVGELLAELRALKAEDLATKRTDPAADRHHVGRAIYDLMRALRALREADHG
jgi:hypothetical protein